MARQYQEKSETTQQLTAIGCDKCGMFYDMENNFFEAREFLSWSATGGYGSVFGDMSTIEIDLCQHCVQSLLRPYLRIKLGNW